MNGTILAVVLVVVLGIIAAACAHARRRHAEPVPPSPDDALVAVSLDAQNVIEAARLRRGAAVSTFSLTGLAPARPTWSTSAAAAFSVVWVSGGDDVAPDSIIVAAPNGRSVQLQRVLP